MPPKREVIPTQTGRRLFKRPSERIGRSFQLLQSLPARLLLNAPRPNSNGKAQPKKPWKTDANERQNVRGLNNPKKRLALHNDNGIPHACGRRANGARLRFVRRECSTSHIAVARFGRLFAGWQSPN